MRVKNIEVLSIIEFLHGMKLSGKASIGRTNLIKVLQEKQEEYGNDQITIIDEFDTWTDKEKGTFNNENVEQNEALTTLGLANVKIKFKSPFEKDLALAIENYNEEVSGTQAEAFALLYEEFVKEND